MTPYLSLRLREGFHYQRGEGTYSSLKLTQKLTKTSFWFPTSEGFLRKCINSGKILYIKRKIFNKEMKKRVNMSLEKENVKKLDRILEKVGMPRSTFIDKIIKDINFVVRNIKENRGYYIVEQILTRLYSIGLIDYPEIVKTLGPKRAEEIAHILRSTERFKEWIEK